MPDRGPDKTECCATCLFWRGAGAQRGSFQCRRHAPSLKAYEWAGGTAHDGVWPFTTGDEWCGEWQEDTGV